MPHLLSTVIATLLALNYGYAVPLPEDADEMAPRAPPDVTAEARMTTPQIIGARGYPVVEHKVTTADGYRMKIYRIPNGKGGSTTASNKAVVFLQHGLLDAGQTWVVNFQSQSLAFILADAGYDVWLGNVRGNTYGKEHTSLSTSKNEFWAFTFDDMARNDLPSMLQYVLDTTRRADLYYVGHSQGCMIGLVGFPLAPSIASKVRLFVQLAPAAWLANVKGAMPLIAPFASSIDTLNNWFGSGEFLPSNAFMEFLAINLCGGFTQVLCTSLMWMITGYDANNMNQTRLPVYLGYAPAGTSSRNMVHFAQLISSKKFCRYDHGKTQNNKLYGTATPPDYDVTKMTIKTAVLYSAADWMATKKDIEGNLIPRLPNIVFKKDYVNLQHQDFVWSHIVYNTVYKDVLDLIKKN